MIKGQEKRSEICQLYPLLPKTIDNTAECIFADWARQCVKLILDRRMNTVEYKEFQNDPRYHDIMRFILYADVALDKIRWFRDNASSSRSLFEAFQECVVHILERAGIEPRKCIIVVHIDDVDQYLDDRKIGEVMLQSFLNALADEITKKSTCRYRINDKDRSKALRIIVISKYLYMKNKKFWDIREDSVNSHIIDMLPRPYSKKDCENSLNSLTGKLQELGLSTKDAGTVIDYAYEETNGYSWFFNRFIKAVLLLRRSTGGFSLDETLRFVSDSSIFWYYDKSVLSVNLIEYLKKTVENERPFPLFEENWSEFFFNIIQEIFDHGTKESRLEWYENHFHERNHFDDAIFFPTIQKDEPDYPIEDNLLPLRNVGLIEQKSDLRYIITNNIIKKFFNPKVIRNIKANYF